MTKCPKCGMEHEPFGVLRWLWLFRDTKPKPPGTGGLVLAMLATRMDPKTGCGWTTDPDLAELAEVDSLRTVYGATRWARDRLLMYRARKGYRITGQRGQKSLWILTDPAREPTGNRLPHGKAAQPATSDRMGGEPTGNLTQANRQSDDDPTGNRLPSVVNPEKLDQEDRRPRRTTRTGSRGEPAATDDDDDSNTQPADLDGGAEGVPAAVRDRPGPGFGLCPECRDWYVVSKGGGRLARHDADLGGGLSWCPGSGREPVEPVPCAGAECGRTGLALTGFAGLCRACREAAKAAEVPW